MIYCGGSVALGGIPAPFTTYAYYNSDKFHFYGEERMQRSMAYRSFFDAGIFEPPPAQISAPGRLPRVWAFRAW